MPVFPKPDFAFDYNVADEVTRLRNHRKTRDIPKREKGKLLAATWNIANLGAQERRDQDRSLIAEILSWFDIVAIQECRENFGDLFDLHNKLPKSFHVIMSDVAGNNERMAFLFDSQKLTARRDRRDRLSPFSLQIDQAPRNPGSIQRLRPHSLPRLVFRREHLFYVRKRSFVLLE